MDVDTFSQIGEKLIDLIKRELNDLNSARVQMTTWIRFVKDDDQVELAFNSRMTNVHRGSDIEQIVDEMFTHIKTQIENPALPNSRFVFDEVLFLDINFHQTNLTRGSSYLPLPDFIARKKAVINPYNGDEECFKWVVITAESIEIRDPQRVSNLRKFVDNYDWSGLEFLVSIKDIGKFEVNNGISVNVLGLEGIDIYIHRNSNYQSDRKINLFMITEDGVRHYTVIKSLSRLLSSRNSKHAHKQYFCTNCSQGFSLEVSRNQHQVYCKDNEAVRVEMPRKGKTIELFDGQNQFKVPFTMYYDLEVLLLPMKERVPEDRDEPLVKQGPRAYTIKVNHHVPCGWNVRSKFAYGEVTDPDKSYRGRNCIKALCEHFVEEAHQLYHMFPEKPMNPLTGKEWK